MRVLIQCGDLLENQHRIYPLAQALKTFGVDPIILHYKKSTGAFFKSRDIKIVHLDDYRTAIKSREVVRSAMPAAFWDDRTYPIYGIQHGLKGSPRADLGRDLFMLRRSGLALIRLLNDTKIDSLIVWNGVTGHVANALRIIGEGQGIADGYLERGYLRNSVFFDRTGTNGESSLARGIASVYNSAEISRSVNSLGGFVNSTLVNLVDTRATGRKEIFVPLQVQQDSNILLYSRRVKTMRHLVLDAVQLARSLGPDWVVVVRDHPEETQSALNIPYGDRVWRDNSSTLEERINSSRIVFTVNSTVGLTAALAGKVVVCSGEGIYCREPFVINRANLTPAETLERVQSALEAGPNREELVQYMAVLLDRHQIFDGNNVLAGPYTTRALSHYGEYAPIVERQSLIERVREKVKTASDRFPGGLAIQIQLTPNDSLELTYRKSSERITSAWIMEALAKNFAEVPFKKSSREEPARPENSICICSAEVSAFNTDHDRFVAVLDQYGEPHLRYYQREEC